MSKKKKHAHKNHNNNYNTVQKLAEQKQENKNIVLVKNAEGDPDTTAEIVIQNKIDYEPKVSVIIPVYNVEEYLRECLDSVVNQTLKEIEIICVDDGSTDSSLEILKEYAKKDNRITVMKQANLHAGVARNAGLAVAKGEYLSFLDSDDFFELNMLEEMSQKADVDGSDIVVCGNFIYDEYKKEDVRNIPISNVYLNESPFQPKKFANSLFLITNPNPWTKLIKRNLFENNELKFESFKRCNDLTCVYTALSLAKQISLIDGLYVHYRSIRKGNSTSERSKQVDLFLHAINKLEKNLKKHNLLDTFYPTFVQRVKSSFSWEIANCSEKQKDIIQKQAKNILSDILYNELFKPKVSVIIPVYNVEKYLRDCLDSAINQTLKEIEIICVNDGSTDSSLDILKEYGKKDSRIVIINQNNQGLSCSRNNAMKIAKAEYILFLDSDDWIRKDSCEILYTHAKKYDLDMLNFEGQRYIDETKKIEYSPALKIDYVQNENKYYTIHEIEAFVSKIPISACLMFYKKSFLDKNLLYFPDGLFFEDNVFVHKALNTLSRFGIKKEKLYFRRTHSEQTTQKWNKLFADYIQIIKMVCELYKQNNLFSNDTKNQIITNYIHGGIYRFSTFTKDEQQIYIGKLYECISSIIENNPQTQYISKFIQQYNPIVFYRKSLENWYFKSTKKDLDLDNPKTYNEKMQWLKLYNSTPIKTRLADKYLVRDWVKETIGEEYLIPLLGVYDKFDEIDFNKLPDKFVMKCNHGSGWNIIVPDKSKLNLQDAKSKIDRWMNDNYAFKGGCELHYRDIEPKIIIEEYIEPAISNHEIQAWVFNNKIKFISVETIKDAENLERGTFYPDGTRTEFEVSPGHFKKMEKMILHDAFNEVISIAKKMTVDVPYVRIDFIEYKGRIKFREMTFTSGSGLSQIEPKEAVIKLGNWIKLPKLAYNIDTGEYYKVPKTPFWKKQFRKLNGLVKPYYKFPYYLLKLSKMRKKVEKLQVKAVLKSLTPMRVDIKNNGIETNGVAITSNNVKMHKPAWFKNAQGQGAVVETNEMKSTIKIKAINDGNLTFDFRGSDKRCNNLRFPVFVDYKSIKINNKELLNTPVETWHDKPFRYSMPVKNGQEVILFVEQTYHKYTIDGLKDVVLKLHPTNDFVKKNILTFAPTVLNRMQNPNACKKEKKQDLKHFLFHKKKTNTCIKFYVCNIRVWKKQVNIHKFLVEQLEFFSNRQASQIANINSKMQTQKNELIAQINKLKNENADLKAKIDALSSTIGAVADEFNTQFANQSVYAKKHTAEILVQGKKTQQLLESKIKYIENKQVDLANNIKKEMDNIALLQNNLEAKVKADVLSAKEANLFELNKINEEISANKEKLVVFEDLISNTNQQINEAIVSSINANSDNILRLQNIVKSRGEDITSEISALYKEQSSQLQSLKEQAQSNRENIVAKLDSNNTNVLEFKKDILNKYQELNYADLLHDSIINCEWLKNKSFSLYGWAANYSFIYLLFRTLDKVCPTNILEMGLGQTTKLTSQYIAYKNNNARLNVCEHNKDWIDIYSAELPKSDHIKINHFDLEFFDYEGKQNDKYANILEFVQNQKFDLIIVDGPVGGGKNLPRSNILDLIQNNNLADDFVIIFDDAERMGEKTTIAKAKELLTQKGVEFTVFGRNGIKNQLVITSQSRSFLQFL